MNRIDYIEKINSELEMRNAQVTDLQRQLEMIHYSRFWRLRNKIRNVLDLIKHPKKIGPWVNNKISKKSEYIKVEECTQVKSVYQDNMVFDGAQTDVKAIAFHLPQFHTFKENDEWWGEGFTEWTNSKKAIPRFEGHYQPRMPHSDIGFYDLSDIDVLKKQAQLAKEHGIYGFCFYYYWFSGKRLMEKVVDQLLEHPEIDLPFCLCWANENWTRTWDGLEKSILIGQDYSDDDPKKFIKDIKKYLDDKRYIRVDGKPVVMLYNPGAIPEVEKVLSDWRKYAKKEGIGDLYIIVRNLIGSDDVEVLNCDAMYDFAPLNKGFDSAVLELEGESHAFDYEKTVDEIINLYRNYNSVKPHFLTSMMAWDNSSRRPNGFNVFAKYSLEAFYKWNREIIDITREKYAEKERFMFINAWNEWCEGTYLEPDEKYGYANINTLSKALFDIPLKNVVVINDDVKIDKNFTKKIAVQVHLFHDELITEIAEQLNNIPYSYDCFITTDTEEKKKKILSVFKKISSAKNVYVDVTENRGRDVAPFLVQISKVYKNYDYICHIHSKKSKTVEYGDHWRTYNYNHLFGSKENVAGIFELFEKNNDIGMIYPYNFPVITEQTNEFGINIDLCKEQYNRLGIPLSFINDKLEFAAGTMFWAKMDAILPVFETMYDFQDFPVEAGQLDGTIAHALERTFVNLAKSRGFRYVNTYNNSIKKKADKKKRVMLYLVNDDVIDDASLDYLSKVKEYVNKVVVVYSSSDIRGNKKLESLVDDYLFVDSIFELDKFKEGLAFLKNDLNKYDEVVISNDNCMLSNISFDSIFSDVNKNGVRVLNYHGKLYDLEEELEYIKTEFIIFSTNVMLKIYDSIMRLKKCTNYSQLKINYNKGLTDILSINNIELDIFIPESKYIRKYLLGREIDLTNPLYMVLLGSPIINKRSRVFVSKYDQLLLEDFIKQCK